MRYKLIIVDDEKAMLNSLNNIFDWNDMGFELCGMFCNGKQAAEYISAHPVDVVLTDITMPLMNGLELAKWLHETAPHIKTILISGYQDFEFARQAIQYNVVHYLLKPTRYQEVLETFAAVRRQLDQEKKNIGELIPMVARQFFFDLTAGVIQNRETIDSYLELLGLEQEMREHLCCFVLLKLEAYEDYMQRQWKHELEGFFNAMQQLLACRYESIRFYLFHQDEAYLKLVGICTEDMEQTAFYKEAENYFGKKKQEMSELMHVTFRVEQLEVYDTLLALGQEIQQKAIGNGDVQEGYRNLLLHYIQSGNLEAVGVLLRQYFDSFGQDVEKAKQMSLSVLGEVEEEGSFGQLLDSCSTIEELRKASYSVFAELMSKEENHADASKKHLIHKAKEFIAAHCCEAISLEMVANNIYVSPVYLSRLFKEQTNQNFSDYVTQLRMQQAMELLKNPALKVYEVSEKVGYRSLKYFYKIFKQYIGVTPTEYRNRLNN